MTSYLIPDDEKKYKSVNTHLNAWTWSHGNRADFRIREVAENGHQNSLAYQQMPSQIRHAGEIILSSKCFGHNNKTLRFSRSGISICNDIVNSVVQVAQTTLWSQMKASAQALLQPRSILIVLACVMIRAGV